MEVVTNGVPALMHNGLNFLDGLAPFVVKSQTQFEIADDGYGGFEKGISSKSDSPVVFDADVRIHSNNNNPKYTLALVSAGRSYMQFNGRVRRENSSQEFLLRPMGDIRFGGETVCSNVMFSATPGAQRYTAVTCCNIQQRMDPVAEIHVGASARFVHNLGSRCSSFVRMARRVFLSKITLGFKNAELYDTIFYFSAQKLAEKLRSKLGGGAQEIFFGKDFAHMANPPSMPMH